MSTPHDHLTDALTRQAEQATRGAGPGLSVEQVVARAGEIRRGRRMRASIVMAACALAVAGPAGIVALQDDPASAPQPAAPTRVDTTPLTLIGLERGDEPQRGYFADGTFRAGGAEVDLSAVDGPVRDVASLQGGVLVTTQTESGDLAARFVDQFGSPSAESRPVEGGFAVSEDRRVGAFLQPNGVPVVVQDGGKTWIELPDVPGSGFDTVAVSGEDCRRGAACTVWVVSKGDQPLSWAVTPEGVTETSSTIRRVADVADGGLLAGITEVRDDGTCSAVVTAQAEEWSTCVHRFVSFSPNGRHLLATDAYGDALGGTQLAILDAADGKVALDLSTEGGFISEMVWEDDSHVLAEVFEAGRWALLRVGLDGSREYAVAPVAGEDVESPFALPAD